MIEFLAKKFGLIVCKIPKTEEEDLRLLSVFKPLGVIVARKDTVNRDAEIVYMKGKTEGLRSGKEIGILQVLRYNQQTLSPAKFKESAKFFDFDGLNVKYPFNPLFERPHEKADQDQ